MAIDYALAIKAAVVNTLTGIPTVTAIYDQRHYPLTKAQLPAIVQKVEEVTGEDLTKLWNVRDRSVFISLQIITRADENLTAFNSASSIRAEVMDRMANSPRHGQVYIIDTIQHLAGDPIFDTDKDQSYYTIPLLYEIRYREQPTPPP